MTASHHLPQTKSKLSKQQGLLLLAHANRNNTPPLGQHLSISRRAAAHCDSIIKALRRASGLAWARLCGQSPRQLGKESMHCLCGEGNMTWLGPSCGGQSKVPLSIAKECAEECKVE